MRKIVLTLLMAVFLGTSFAAVSEGSEPLTKEAAANALKTLAPDIKVLAIEPSPVEGLWEVVVMSRGNIGIVYVDGTARYIVSGAMLDVVSKQNLTRDHGEEATRKYEQFTRVDFKSIPLEDALVLGKKDAKHKVVVFDDPD